MENMTVKLVTILIIGIFLGSSLLIPGVVNASPDGLQDLQDWFDANGYSINVYTDELGIEMFPSGYCEVTILNGEHGYPNPTGWYTSNEEPEIHLLFPDPKIGENACFTSEESFGFYIDSYEGRFFTETELNADEFDHALVFNNAKGLGYIIAFEDQYGGGDQDYEDRIIEVVIGNSLNEYVTLFFPLGSEIVEATATETTRYPPPPTDGFIGPVLEIEVTGTFSGLVRVRIYYGEEAESDPTEILQTDIVLGDVNADGKVNCKDLFIITKALGSSPASRRWNVHCDLNGDNRITLADLCIAIRNLGQTSEWTPLTNTFVNHEQHYIEGDTDHFSIFGVH